MTIKKIPYHVETLFRLLCDAYGATCNKSSPDERGWDYFVQFEARPGTGLAALRDMHPRANECLVQIKSRRGSNASIQLKLSNAERFAKTLTPCFIVVVPYEGGREPDNVYLLHFWKREIERTLKKIRTLDAKGEAALHRISIVFPAADMVHLPRAELLAHMERLVDEHKGNYENNKRAIIDKAGYSGPEWAWNVVFDEQLDDIVDQIIGLTEVPLKASSVSIRSIRFGIEKELPNGPVSGRISIKSKPKKCVLVLSSEPEGQEVSLQCDLFGPAIPNLPKEHRRFRVVHPFVEMVGHDADRRSQFFFTAQLTDRRTISEMATLLDLMHVAAAPRIRFRLLLEGKTVLSGTGNAAQPLPFRTEMPSIVAFVSFLQANTRPHDLPDDLQFSLVDLVEQASALDRYNEIATTADVSGTLLGTLTVELPIHSGKAIATPWVELPHHTVYAIVKRDVRIKQTGSDAIAFSLGNFDYARVRVLRGDFEATESDIERETELCLKETPDELVIVFPRTHPVAASH